MLEAALESFARFGYRKTSMDEVATRARISRPGLYFLFSSKPALFRVAMEHAIESDLAEAERALGDLDRTLPDRVIAAFDSWAGRYIGPMSDAQSLVADNPDLVGPIALAGPERFRRLLQDALRGIGHDAEVVTETLSSVSVGLKHQVTDRTEYARRLRRAVELILGPSGPGSAASGDR